MDDTTKTIAAGFIRHGLTLMAGSLITAGYLDANGAPAFVGGGMAMAAVMWSWWQKVGQAHALAILARMHPVAAPMSTQAEAVKAANIAVKAEEAK